MNLWHHQERFIQERKILHNVPIGTLLDNGHHTDLGILLHDVLRPSTNPSAGEYVEPEGIVRPTIGVKSSLATRPSIPRGESCIA